jgi:hypothetical protein
MGERGKAEIEMDLRNIVNIYIYIYTQKIENFKKQRAWKMKKKMKKKNG